MHWGINIKKFFITKIGVVVRFPLAPALTTVVLNVLIPIDITYASTDQRTESINWQASNVKDQIENNKKAAEITANKVEKVETKDRCPKINLSGLKHKFAGRGSMNLIFFASWCSSCKPHLKAEAKSDEILIAAFDEQQAAEKVLESFKVTTPCFTSDGIVEELGIPSVPYEKKITF